MHCKSPIEWAYYNASKTNTRKDVCCHCSKIGAKVDSDKKKLYKSVLPVCDQCEAQGKKILKRGSIQTTKANRGPVVLKTIRKFMFKILLNKSICYKRSTSQFSFSAQLQLLNESLCWYWYLVKYSPI